MKKRTMWLVIGMLLLVSVLVWAESYPINHKCQLSTEANCKLLLHMNEASWNGTPNEVKDASGCGNHGVAGGGVTTITGGKFSRCGSFDGVGDYVNCGNESSFHLPSGFTLEMWLKGTAGRPMGKYTDANRMWKFTQNALYLYDDSADANIGRTHPVNLWDNKWHHYVGTWNGGTLPTSIKIYVDGVQVDNSSISSGTFVNIEDLSEPLTIGVDDLGNPIWWNGLIDEVAIYNKALSAEEIYQHYHKQIGVHIN